jgi:hypothetical protein
LVTSAIRSQIVVAGADMNTVAEPRIRRSLTTKTVRRKRKRPFEAEYALLAELGLRRNGGRATESNVGVPNGQRHDG